MKRLLTKISPNANTLLRTSAIFLCTILCSCTIGPWEKEFWNPPAATGAAPIESGKSYAIPRATGENLAAWPRLGDVPDRTEPPLTQDEILHDTTALERDRDEALDAAARLARDADSAIDSTADITGNVSH